MSKEYVTIMHSIDKAPGIIIIIHVSCLVEAGNVIIYCLFIVFSIYECNLDSNANGQIFSSIQSK